MRRWREHHELEAQVERLENALERRALIERAKGILMERHSLDDRAAFQRVREHARSTNRTVVDVAAAVAEGHALLPKAQRLAPDATRGDPAQPNPRGSAPVSPRKGALQMIGIVIASPRRGSRLLAVPRPRPAVHRRHHRRDPRPASAAWVPAATGCVPAGASSPPRRAARPTASASGARRCARSWCARARTSSRTR